MKMLVIADDFSGANDTAVQFAKNGAVVEMSMDWREKEGGHSDVWVVNTDSRALSPSQAAQRVMESIRAQNSSSGFLLYKKIDSTLRGNLGAEISIALKELLAQLAIVVPAIPAAGRTTVQGSCLVNGIPLLDTEFARDPKTPITSSRIKTVLQQQTSLPVIEVDLERVRGGELAEYLQYLCTDEPCIVVIDAETTQDLEDIGQSLSTLLGTILLVGAAGLAEALPPSLYTSKSLTKPALIVAGSMSEVTRQQVIFARQHAAFDVVEIDVNKLLTQPEQMLTIYAEQATDILAQSHHCVLWSTWDVEVRERIALLSQTHGLSRQQLADKISGYLGILTDMITRCAQIGGLFLTGGDVAMAVAKALKAKGYRIMAEVAPCIPFGILAGSKIEAIPVITKAGGFGTESLLKDAIHFLERKVERVTSLL